MTRSEPKRQRALCRETWILAALLVVLATFLGNLMFGRIILDPTTLWRVLTSPSDEVASIFAWDLRLPRALIGLAVGACLALAGAVMQGAVRNDLAAPELIGVTAGAAFGVVVSGVWFGVSSGWQPFCGLLGGSAAVLLTACLAWKGSLSPMRLMLAGLAVSALAWAGINAALIAAGPQAGSLFFWLVGGLAGRSWRHVSLLWPWALAGFALAFILAPALNILALGEAEAKALGLSVGATRLAALVAVMTLTVGAVSVAGPIAFIGLIVPHFVRRLYGMDHRRLLPLSALFGAALLSAADLGARFLGGPFEVPVGMITALIGGPLMLRELAKG